MSGVPADRANWNARRTSGAALADLRLYLVTDRNLTQGRNLLEVVDAAIAGGVTAVQLREKELPGRQFTELALAFRRLTRERGALFLVNDRVDIALAVDADGAHVGQDDIPAAMARRLLGPDRVLGVSARTPEQARAAEADGADYIGAGAVFATSTKIDAESIGLGGLVAIARAVHIPVVAIGGINNANAAAVLETGVDGLAVVSAIVAARDVAAAATALRRTVDSVRH